MIPLYATARRFRGALIMPKDPFGRISMEEYMQGAAKAAMQTPNARLMDAKQKVFEDEARRAGLAGKTNDLIIRNLSGLSICRKCANFVL